MASRRVLAVCGACAPRVAAIPPLVDRIARFLFPLSASAISKAVAARRELLALFLLETLACESAVSDLDRRLRARRTMMSAAAVGAIAVMDKAHRCFGCRIDASVVREAVRGGQQEVVEWLYVCLVGHQDETPANYQTYSEEERRQCFPSDLPVAAVENDDLGMLKALVKILRTVCDRSEHSVYLDEAAKSAARAAARCGRTHIINWLQPRFKLPEEYELANEAHTGRYEAGSIQERPCERCRCRQPRDLERRPACTQWRMDYAASCGRLGDAQWFHLNRPEHCFSSLAIDGAASNGHLHVVRWLHDSQPDLGCTTAAMNGSAGNGHLGVVQWLHDNRSEGCTGIAMDQAAANGHLEVLKFLATAGVRGSPRALLVGPAENGHLDVVRWLLLEYGREERLGGTGLWSMVARAVDAAAAHGHVEVVKFLLTHAPEKRTCIPNALAEAAGNNHESIVRWLLEEHHDECLDVTESLHFSPTARTRTLQRGSQVVRAVQSAATNGHLGMAQLLFDFQRQHGGSDATGAGCDMLHKALISAAGHGHLATAKWLLGLLASTVASSSGPTAARDDHGALSTTLADALYLAVGGCDVPVLRWLCGRPELPEALRLRAIDSSSLVIGFNNAVGSANFAMLDWIREQQLDVDFKSAICRARSDGNPEVVEWLQRAKQ